MWLPKNRGKSFGIVASAVAIIVLLPMASDAGTGSTQAILTTKTYVRTLVGTDFRSLDVNFFPQFVSGAGGGVYALSSAQVSGTEQQYFEATVDLPNGALVTEVSLYVRSCGLGVVQTNGYFGAYTPTQGGFAQYAALTVPSQTSCATTVTVTRKGAPLTTVDTATKRYVIGTPLPFINGNRPVSPDWILVGARIKWTCTSACA